MEINIKKGYYNRTVCKDGITHEVDTGKKYPYYEVEIYGKYYDIESKEQLKKAMKEDLEKIVKALEEKEIER